MRRGRWVSSIRSDITRGTNRTVHTSSTKCAHRTSSILTRSMAQSHLSKRSVISIKTKPSRTSPWIKFSPTLPLSSKRYSSSKIKPSPRSYTTIKRRIQRSNYKKTSKPYQPPFFLTITIPKPTPKLSGKIVLKFPAKISHP